MGSTAISEAVRTTDNGRQSWHDYFLSLAESISTRATCERLKVGCLFVRDNRILATGYNGSLPGQAHCTEAGCLLHNDRCIRSVHAECNAICQAAQHGVSLQDSWLYVTHLCCIVCYKNVLAAGCSRVYYNKDYYGAVDMSIYRSFQGMSRLEQIK